MVGKNEQQNKGKIALVTFAARFIRFTEKEIWFSLCVSRFEQLTANWHDAFYFHLLYVASPMQLKFNYVH